MAVRTNNSGTDGNDILTFNDVGFYDAGYGNDTIKIEGGKGIVVYTFGGVNTIQVTAGSNHIIRTALTDEECDKINGTDKLTVNGANLISGHLGAGKDEITLLNTNGKTASGALSLIRSGAWGDTFTIGTGATGYQLYGDAGDDIFNIKGGSNIVCWGGAANDTFNVTGGTGIKLRGGDSADVYNVSVDGVDMQLGYGNDVVNVTAGNSQKIKANLGINTINLKAGSGHVITADIDQAASKKVGKEVGYGVDKVNISGSATKVTANLGDGKDEVTVSVGSGHKIYTEGWGDTLNVFGNVSSSTFDTGDGDDIINISGTGTYNTYYAREGKDKITVSGGTGTSIDLGSGNDEITISAGSISTLKTSAGNNDLWLKGTGQISTLYLGSGRETIKVDGGTISTVSNTQNATIDMTINGGTVEETGCGSKDDWVAVRGGTLGKLNTGAGDDYIEITGGKVTNDSIHGDAGKDTFLVSSPGYNLYGDDGDDIFWIATPMEVNPTTMINGGNGNDSFILSGQNNTVWAGAGNDAIVALGDCKDLSLILEEGDDMVAIDESISIYTGRIRGGNGEDNIELKGYSENVSVYGDAQDDTIFVGNNEKTGKNNKLYGEEGNDKLLCVNNKYALVVGGIGNDTITCTDVTYGVILGDHDINFKRSGSDTIYLKNVSQSFIDGTSGNSDTVGIDNNTITVSGNCSKDIIFGGYGSNTLWVNGALTNSLLLGGKSKDEISITNDGCQYNKIFGGGNDDTYRISAGSNNTITGGSGNDTFYISGGSNNKFVGGSSADTYYVTTYGQNYNMIEDWDGYNHINVNYNSKVLIATNNGVVNIYGAKLKDFEIQYHDHQFITRFNDIYIYSSGRFNPEINFYDGTISNPGALTSTFAERELYTWEKGILKSGTLTEMQTRWDLLESQMGENNKAVAIDELSSELNTVYDGIQTNIKAVYSYVTSSK